MSKNKTVIHLSDHFTTGRLLRYALPSIGMMIFTSVYSVVDGFFVSNIVGKTSFAAVNLILPVLEILGALGYVFGTGGSALVSKELGEGRREEASETFSLMVCTTIAVGVFVAVVGTPLLRPILRAIGARGAMLEEAMAYGTILMPAMIIFMLQYMFQAFFITAEKPKLGFALTVIAGLTNMFLDWLFMAVFHWGIRGAALATALAQVIGGAVPIVYFARPNTAALHLGRPRFRFSKIKKAAANGASEFMTTVSLSIVSICYNMQLIRFAGQDGVAAYGVIMYVNFIFLAVFIGYATGTAPIVGFHFGAGHKDELHGILKRSLSLIAVTGVVLTAAAEILARPLSMIFVSYDAHLLAMTVRGFRLYSLSYLLAGFNIYGSSFFTALNNGFVSAAISFLRTLVFETGCVWLLPAFFGLTGIWFAIIVAEVLALVVTGTFLRKNRARYGY